MESAAGLESALARVVAEAEGAWPALVVPTTTFLAYVAARLEAPVGPEDLPLSVRGGDLYIACACAGGSLQAIAALEARFFADIEGALARVGLRGGTDDVKQTLRMKLFVGDGVTPPQIAEYAGRGDLRGWLKVTAVRDALKIVRKDKGETLVEDDALFDGATRESDPELGFMKQVYRDAFRSAFQEALDGLEDREKNLLRQHVVDGVAIDALGTLYGVHRATAARWLSRARENLLRRTREQFMARARVSRAECASILRMVQSNLDATIRRRLEATPEPRD